MPTANVPIRNNAGWTPFERYIREWIDLVVTEMDGLPAALRNEEPIELTLTLTIDIEEGVQEEFSRELDRLAADIY